jgi:ABC-2 type transport system ATP-binding protein
MAAIRVQNLSFNYGPREALKQVSFEVEQGQIFGLLGPNGGGKTTLFRILCTLLKPLSGTASILDIDVTREPEKVRALIGVVFQSNCLDPQLSLRENLVHQGHLYGFHGQALRLRVDRMLDRFGLTERSREMVRQLSGGLRRRLELARGLLHDPRVLLLDEPTVGVDPGIRHDFWSQLQGLRRKDGITVLLTTHLMEEAERCDQLAILHEGRIVAKGSPDQLRSRISGDMVVIQTDRVEEIEAAIRERHKCPVSTLNGTIRVEHPNGRQLLQDLMTLRPEAIQSVTVGRPTLEDVFVRETGRHLWEGNPSS